MRISDWSSDVCSSDLERLRPGLDALVRDGALDGYDMAARYLPSAAVQRARQAKLPDAATLQAALDAALADSPFRADVFGEFIEDVATARRSEEHTSELKSLMRISYAVLCLKKNKHKHTYHN